MCCIIFNLWTEVSFCNKNWAFSSISVVVKKEKERERGKAFCKLRKQKIGIWIKPRINTKKKLVFDFVMLSTK